MFVRNTATTRGILETAGRLAPALDGKKRMRQGRWMTAAVRAALGCLALAGIALAGEWHAKPTAVCSDCHTMHDSKRGVAMRYDGSAEAVGKLLRNENPTLVCLACHDGSKAGVPNVRAPSDYDPPGGGFPADPFATDPDHHFHTLSTTPVVPPDGTTAVTLTCASCHDSHGNGFYRNLRPSPGGRAAAAPVVAQDVTANGKNAAAVYVRSNVRYVSGMSEWCIDCHDAITSAHGDPAVTVHPWDVPIFDATKASYAAWSAVAANRVPVQNPLGATKPPPDQGDRVFCLSCHKAHGSPARAALIRADQSTTSSTCLECHDP